MTTHAMTGAVMSRRGFLIGATLAGTGLEIAWRSIGEAQAVASFQPNPFIRIPSTGKIAVVVPAVEMGQGVYTSFAMLIAEELEVSLDDVVVEHAPADRARYANPLLGEQITGGSISIRTGYEPIRRAGAAARIMLVGAAARQWGVDPASCRAEAGAVLHGPSGRRSPYGSLIAAAAAEAVPQDPPLKAPDGFRLIGRRIRRIDGSGKVDGSAVFGIDVRPAGLSHAAIAICPVFGGRLGSVEAAPALQVRGVKQVVTTGDSVAVVADNTGTARKGLAALKIEWIAGANGTLSSADLEQRAEAALEGRAVPHVETGDTAAAERNGVHEFVYRLPILAHTAMEPMNCTLHVRPDGCDVWVGTQVMGRARQAVADVTGLPVESVVVHNHLLGGGFGRRLDVDGIVAAARIAREVAGPLKVTWSREEDIRHDCYRYLNYSKVVATLGPDGLPLSWRHRVIGPGVMFRFLPLLTKGEIDLDIMSGAESPYAIPNKRTEFVRHEAPDGMLTGNWRGVGATRNLPAVEGAIDELAHLAGIDPVEYRRRLLGGNPRLRRVLETAAATAGWSKALPQGRGRGVALLEDFGSVAAMVCEVTVGTDGRLTVDRVVCAVDCGQVVNPDTVEAQIQSGIVYGLSAALYGRITVENGAVVEGNFDDAPVLRIHEMPRVDVVIVDSAEPPGGIGEVGTPGVAPSLLNAVFMATGKRLRTLPLDTTQLRRA